MWGPLRSVPEGEVSPLLASVLEVGVGGGVMPEPPGLTEEIDGLGARGGFGFEGMFELLRRSD